MDATLTELATVDAGPLAEGCLFGDKFVKDIAKYVRPWIRDRRTLKRYSIGAFLGGLGEAGAAHQAIRISKAPREAPSTGARSMQAEAPSFPPAPATFIAEAKEVVDPKSNQVFPQDLSRSPSKRRILSRLEGRDVISSVAGFVHAHGFPLRMFIRSRVFRLRMQSGVNNGSVASPIENNSFSRNSFCAKKHAHNVRGWRGVRRIVALLFTAQTQGLIYIIEVRAWISPCTRARRDQGTNKTLAAQLPKSEGPLQPPSETECPLGGVCLQAGRGEIRAARLAEESPAVFTVPARGDVVSVKLDNSASGASVVAIDNKIEQAMDLVKNHLMYAVREEVETLKEQIKELVEKNSQLERENSLLKNLASPEQMQKFQSRLPSEDDMSPVVSSPTEAHASHQDTFGSAVVISAWRTANQRLLAPKDASIARLAMPRKASMARRRFQNSCIGLLQRKRTGGRVRGRLADLDDA
ncbi:hypothetical protein NDU88_006273 [Pleurodeles waltl]|uniref:TSC22 domain family protein 3 n=1 Tax=Pleurodeles waltl TaxID=8319 RepID=A0AAV7MCY7_PLEWA|nr:hypothetical protein NDU88_006273 [Pleurodeles waltl]